MMKTLTCLIILMSFSFFSQINELKKSQEIRKEYIDFSKSTNSSRQKYNYIKHVNPFIGTGAHGHTFPGAVAPFGMMQLSPDTRYNGWDGCSGYHYSDSVIFGFSHTHLSGTGVEDLCDLLITPQQGKINPIPKYINENGYGLKFKHENEIASPGFYGVNFEEEKINVRLTVNERSGIHEYTFQNPIGDKIIFINLEHRDKLIDSKLNAINSNTISGYRISNSWAKNQHFYFHLETEIPFKYKFYGKTKIALIFPENSTKILLKVGISNVDENGAKNNLFSEIPNFDFESTKHLVQEKWNNELGKIHFTGIDKNSMTNFYTAQYHAYLTPIVFSDVDGRFRGNDFKIYQNKGYNRYSIFSLWDTYRTAHPLYTIVQQKKTNDFIQTFLDIYNETNELPVWELWGNETDCMIGYHTTSVILDAYKKGIKNYDAKLALEAMLISSQKEELGKNHFNNCEFISSHQEPESVSKTLEYAYDDWCISEFAKELNDETNHEKYLKNSYNFINLFHPKNKFMQARKSGIWVPGFIPSEVNFNYTEANSWQYSLATPHAISYHIKLLGGKDSLERWLDDLFSAKSKLEGRQQADITGLIGQYAHGNEPSHHMAYLYNFTNSPHKTQNKIDEILTDLYQPTPEGLSGNEDCGQMSAWYVMSSLGMYPICPGIPVYHFGRPLNESSGFHLENGKSFYIKTINNSSKNKYIKSIILNGKNYNKLYIHHDTIMKGGELIFQMDSIPNINLKKYDSYLYNYENTKQVIIPVPYFTTNSETFTDSISTRISSIPLDNIQIKYTIDGSEPNINSKTYEGENLVFYKTTTIKAKSFINQKENNKQPVSTTFIKVNSNLKLDLKTKFANQYAANGPISLIDGLKGFDDFRSGNWQGFEAEDIIGELNLDNAMDISHINFSCLQDIKSWIFFPTEIIVSTSTDGVNFTKPKIQKINFPNDKFGNILESFQVSIEQKKIKTIKFTVKSIGKCPKGHLGEGEKAWLFLDEIEIK